MYKIEITPEAKNEIGEIVNFIFLDNLFYANKVCDYIYNSIKLLIEYPYVGTEISHNHRYIVESKYRFKIVYKINENKKVIYVISVFKWKNKWFDVD